MVLNQGGFYEMPNSSDGVPLPAQSVTLFNPSYDKDRFENTALTVNGHVGDLKLVYAGAYLVRNITEVQDYTNYSRGLYSDYYQCHGAEPAHGLTATCYSPSTTWNETERNTHQSHELRLSTPRRLALARHRRRVLLRFENPPISEFDLSAGVAKDAWTAGVYVTNLTNVIKSTYTSTNQFVPAEVITRPQVIEFRIGYKF
jgi:hypothetical protein